MTVACILLSLGISEPNDKIDAREKQKTVLLLLFVFFFQLLPLSVYFSLLKTIPWGLFGLAEIIGGNLDDDNDDYDDDDDDEELYRSKHVKINKATIIPVLFDFYWHLLSNASVVDERAYCSFI